jgi:hypothetical protein
MADAAPNVHQKCRGAEAIPAVGFRRVRERNVPPGLSAMDAEPAREKKKASHARGLVTR